jgi:hypothetical protein
MAKFFGVRSYRPVFRSRSSQCYFDFRGGVLTTTVAGSYMNILVVHLYGGEVGDGKTGSRIAIF